MQLVVDKRLNTPLYSVFSYEYSFSLQGKFYETPKSENLKSDQCDPAGCFYELTLNLAIIMIGKQIFSNFLEIMTGRWADRPTD